MQMGTILLLTMKMMPDNMTSIEIRGVWEVK